MPIVAWYMLSNESYMNRVMSEVLPTLCSPRNTSLHRQTSADRNPLPSSRVGIIYLNFFNGLLYPPAAVCAILDVCVICVMMLLISSVAPSSSAGAG